MTNNTRGSVAARNALNEMIIELDCLANHARIIQEPELEAELRATRKQARRAYRVAMGKTPEDEHEDKAVRS